VVTLEGIHEEQVTAWFEEHVTKLNPPLSFGLISGGKSNLTYQVDDVAGKSFVLRRPPLGHILESAHDMHREHWIISSLYDTDVPVAKTYGLCQDKDVNDADFFVMECVAGTVVHDVDSVETISNEDRYSFGKHVAEVLVALHRIEPSNIGLGDLGRREKFLDRQLKRWTRQWEATKTHLEPEMDELLRLLHELKPEQIGATIVHGDYRAGNLMHQNGKVAAVFDWELCTLGDPLADVGYLLNSWQNADEVEELSGASAPTVAGGFPTRDELIDWYATGTGRDLSKINYYRAFSHWRLGCIMQGVYKRFLEGAMGDQEMDLEGYRAGIKRAATNALELLE
jgi:aminoglycoside phosphotransferase (APT) family kinase protein